ncbi:MAG TPA: alpha/beta hydrolase [Terriglobales bacterium]
MLNRREALVAFGALALSSPAHTQEQPTPPHSDLQKLGEIFDFVRKRNAADYAIATPNGIDQAQYLKIGGIEQWVTVRGENRDNPVVLVLHGGPGDCTNPWGYAGFRTWVKNYTIVQWDQRGAGRTLGRNGASSAEMVTIDRLVQDGIELADALRGSMRKEKEKVILFGHSWGSVLGLLMAKKKPELFQAYVGTGQVGLPAGAYDVAFDALLAKAQASGDSRAIRELHEIGPPPYKDGHGYQVQRRWSNLFEGADFFIQSTVGFGLTAPGYTLADVSDWFEGQGLSADRLIPEERALAPAALTGRFSTPVFVIQGAEDFTTPTSVARALVDSVEAPRKAFVTISGGHFAAFMNSAEFIKEMGSLLAAASQ